MTGKQLVAIIVCAAIVAVVTVVILKWLDVGGAATIGGGVAGGVAGALVGALAGKKK